MKRVRFQFPPSFRMIELRTISAFNLWNIGSQAIDISDVECRSELDSHADCCVFGNDTVLEVLDFERPARITGFDNSASQARTCRTITGAVAYTDPRTRLVWMLIIHQGVLVPGMRHNLLCPAQMREVGVRVNDEPKHMALTPTDEHHAITVYGEGREVRLRIPLLLSGINAYFPSRKPTRDEFESTPTERHVDLTDEHREWDPKSNRFQLSEETVTNRDGNLRDDKARIQLERRVSMVLCDVPGEEIIDPEWSFADALVSTIGISRVNVTRNKGKLRPEDLVKRWGISLEVAKRTLLATTQRSLRSTLHPHLSRRYGTNDRGIRYNRLSDDVYTDTMKASVKSWMRCNVYAQVYVTRNGFSRIYPMQKKSQAHETLSIFGQREGVPPNIVMDNAKEQLLGEFATKMRQMQCLKRPIEAYSPWQNAAEGEIRELKRGADRKMTKMNVPKKLWDYCIELESLIRSSTAMPRLTLRGQVPNSITLGQPTDISYISEVEFYEWVRFLDPTASFPEPKEVYGRWLGPSADVGPVMCSHILKKNGHTITQSTFRPLTNDEKLDPAQQEIRREFDKAIADKLGKSPADGDSIFDGDYGEARTPEHELYADDFEGTHEHVPDIDNVTPAEMDNYVGAQINIPYDGEIVTGTVKRRATESDGELRGTANDNPMLDTRMYEVEFGEGQLREYSANVIAENMFAQVEGDGHVSLLFDSIVGHERDDNRAVKLKDAFFVKDGKKYRKKTTMGWKLCVQWKDGSTSWLPLADLKESYPIEVAEYALSCEIDNEPAFRWWVSYVLKKRDRIIAAVKTRYHRTTQKYGFEIPKSVERALQIDAENKNTLWRDALARETKNIRVALDIKNSKSEIPIGYQPMECHMIFDIKLDGFKRKARLVAGGHLVDSSSVMTYAGVVSRDTVRIALTMAALHDLEVKTSDIENAYLTAPTQEKVWTILGPEFEADAKKPAIIVRAVYGLAGSGSAFRLHLADCMKHLGYKPCKADPDLWMKEEIRSSDGFKYWSYILLYVTEIDPYSRY